MTHIDEHTLELFVLGDAGVHKREREIRTHLNECEGCSALFREIADYYEEVAREEQRPVQGSVDLNRRALVRKRNELEPYFEVPRGGPVAVAEVLQPSVWSRASRFTREHPAKTILGLLALTIVSLFSFRALSSESDNPAYFHLDSTNEKVSVYNSQNKLLWSIPCFDLKGFAEFDAEFNFTRTVIADLDGRGKNELVTSLPVGNQSWPYGISIINSRGKIVRIFRFPPMHVSFRGVDYDSPFSAYGLLKDRLPNGKLNLFVVGNNERSPSLVARLDNTLKIEGEYWHYGAIGAWLVENYARSGKELVVAGTDDNLDIQGKSYNFMAILDPDKLSGNSESSATPGFGFEKSPAELYYIRFPETDLARVAHKRLEAGVEREPQDSVFYLGLKSSRNMSDPGSFGFDFVFEKKNMSVREVKFIMPTAETYRLLKEEGKVHGAFNQEYLNRLRDGVRYWTGKRWVKEPTRIVHPDRTESLATKTNQPNGE